MQNSPSETVIYQAPNGEFQLRLSVGSDTLWLSQQQIAALFEVDRTVVGRHLRNIFKEAELQEDKVCAFFAHTAADGKTYRTRFYNLDAVISVGYRVSSKRATAFRVWATEIVSSYMLQGYAVNKRRLLEEQGRKLEELRQVIRTVGRLSKQRQLTGQEGELLELVNQYAYSLQVLEEYDQGTIHAEPGSQEKFALDHDTATRLIGAIRKRAGEESHLFGQEIYGKFKGILGALQQTFDGRHLYRSVEEKAAHLLYFVIKDHPFYDGNKRIGSLLFVYYLQRNGFLNKESGERRVNDNALAALALLIANSAPEEKAVMVGLVVTIVQNG